MAKAEASVRTGMFGVGERLAGAKAPTDVKD